MTRFFRPMIVAGAAVAALGLPVSASDPMGIYCIVEKVVLDPPECPERAQVWGACSTWAGRPGQSSFERARRGYFYYKVPRGYEDLARAEWNDLKSVAGKGQAVGFGKRYADTGHFYQPDDKAQTPEFYPLNVGVVRLGSHDGLGFLLDDLKSAAKGR
jgi:hypothetical protein